MKKDPHVLFEYVSLKKKSKNLLPYAGAYDIPTAIPSPRTEWGRKRVIDKVDQFFAKDHLTEEGMYNTVTGCGGFIGLQSYTINKASWKGKKKRKNPALHYYSEKELLEFLEYIWIENDYDDWFEIDGGLDATDVRRLNLDISSKLMLFFLATIDFMLMRGVVLCTWMRDSFRWFWSWRMRQLKGPSVGY